MEGSGWSGTVGDALADPLALSQCLPPYKRPGGKLPGCLAECSPPEIRACLAERGQPKSVNDFPPNLADFNNNDCIREVYLFFKKLDLARSTLNFFKLKPNQL